MRLPSYHSITLVGTEWIITIIQGSSIIHHDGCFIDLFYPSTNNLRHIYASFDHCYRMRMTDHDKKPKTYHSRMGSSHSHYVQAQELANETRNGLASMIGNQSCGRYEQSIGSDV
ncbi:hypothetical protein TSUD_331050 [Trifolium subterraneum]|uniref:Uncharacterized protein n=1 Tax=Trifolium subterraneum TaxID=3900 RepID=A0A2Z6LYM5_TRISU|nr:hypothetical protein TSUD_331050 [Trifolium subterraneum]